MRRLFLASLLVMALAGLSACNQEPPVTKKAAGYSEKLTAADVIFVEDLKFHENLKTRTTGSLAGRGDVASETLERDMAAYAQRVGAELPAKVQASGVEGHVVVLPPAEVAAAIKAARKAVVIYPVGSRTQCAPCYSVVTFRVDIVHAGQKPAWSTDTKAVLTRADAVGQMWDETVAALRSDGLLAK